MKQPLTSAMSRLAGFLALAFIIIVLLPGVVAHGQSPTLEPEGKRIIPPQPDFWREQRRLEQQRAAGEAGSQDFNSSASSIVAAPDQSSWRQAGGPETGNVYTLLKKDARLFIGTPSGIYTSDDNGERWQPVNNTLRNRFVYSLVRVGATLFAGTSNRVWRSTDDGVTWTLLSAGLPSGQCYKVVVQGNLFAAMPGRGVYRSSNNGDTWTDVSTGLPTLPSNSAAGSAFSFAATGTALFLLVRTADFSGADLYRSTDQGATWTKLNLNLNLASGEFALGLAATTTRVLAGTNGGSLYASDNGGESWVKLASDLQKDLGNFLITPAGSALYLQLDSSVYVSTDNGASFTKKSEVVSSVSNQANGLVVEDGTLFVHSPDGVSISRDGGATWARKNTGLRAAVIYGMAAAGHRLFAGTQGGGAWMSEDGGVSWSQRNNGLAAAGASRVNAWLVRGGALYIGTVRGVHRSTDLGVNWASLNNGLPARANISALASVGTKLYAGSFDGGAYVSSDDGQNWQAVTGLPRNQPFFGFIASGSTILAGSYGGGVFRSTDNGATWMAANAGLARQEDQFVNGFGGFSSGGSTILALTDGGIFRSTDGGTSWTVNLNNVSVLSVARAGRKLYAASYGSGVYVSTDSGNNWAASNQGLTNPNLYTAVISGNSVAVGSNGDGVFVLPDAIAANTTVSAASFVREAIAPGAIVAAFGQELATGTEIATSQPLPTELRGTTVSVLDNAGAERRAPLYFVSSGQINFQIPAGTAAGLATVTIASGDGAVSIGVIDAKPAAPAIFTANASGTGAAAAVDAITGAPAPFNATQSNGQPNIISVFGTSLGGDATDVDGDVKASVTARIDGNPATLFYAGRAPGFTGLNQFNIALPAGISSGVHTLTLARNGVTSNSVTIAIR